MFQVKLTAKDSWKASIGSMRLRLQKLQEENIKKQKIRAEKYENWKKIDKIFYHQSLLCIFKLIKINLISRQHNDLLAIHFSIKKTQELVGKKYY